MKCAFKLQCRILKQRMNNGNAFNFRFFCDITISTIVILNVILSPHHHPLVAKDLKKNGLLTLIVVTLALPQVRYLLYENSPAVISTCRCARQSAR